MKKLFFIILVVLVSTTGIFAQTTDSLKVKIGYFFCPQGVINPQKMDNGTTVVTPVFGVVQFIKGKGLINIMYNLKANNIQIVYFHDITSSVGAYAVSNKNTLDSDGYSGFGFTRNVLNGNAVAFIEGGSNWNKWEPTIFVGAIFPLTFRIK